MQCRLYAKLSPTNVTVVNTTGRKWAVHCPTFLPLATKASQATKEETNWPRLEQRNHPCKALLYFYGCREVYSYISIHRITST